MHCDPLSPIWPSLRYPERHEDHVRGIRRSSNGQQAAAHRLLFKRKAKCTVEANYTYADVAEHHSERSCWVTFQGLVYDLTKYIHVHPGGPKILLDKGGRDMTEDFEVAHGVTHARMISMMEPYQIGRMSRFALHSSAEAWSKPLMYGILEHSNVFTLEWNNFPELKDSEAARRCFDEHFSSTSSEIYRLMGEILDDQPPPT